MAKLDYQRKEISNLIYKSKEEYFEFIDLGIKFDNNKYNQKLSDATKASGILNYIDQ